MEILPKEFVLKTVEAYKANIGVFKNKVNAEDLTPIQSTDQEKALYLFYVIQLDYATKSQNLYKRAKLLWEENKLFFSPKTIIELSDSELDKLIKDYLRPRYVNEASKRYKVNSIKLLTNYRGDPRTIFKTAKNAKEALVHVRKFRGFGPKIGNFFVRTMVNVFDYKYDDIEELLPPVDVWDVKIANFLGYTDTDKMTAKNINNVKSIWSQACKEAGESWLVFDKALWLLGSEGKPKSKEDTLHLLNQPFL